MNLISLDKPLNEKLYRKRTSTVNFKHMRSEEIVQMRQKKSTVTAIIC